MNPKLLAAALVILVTPGCDLPTWDADFNVPLPSQRIRLDSAFGAVIIPAGSSTNVSFPVQQEAMDDAVGDILEDLLEARVIATVTTTVPLDGSDTVFVAASNADLTTPGATRVEVPMTLVAAVPTTLDTVMVPAAAVAMLRNAAQSGSTLFIQLRGRVTYPGPGPRTLAPTDSIGVRLALVARIPVAK